MLMKLGVIVGGDQLTRVRLDAVRALRAHAPDPQGRFDHLQAVVCEMWHNLVDLTEVCLLSSTHLKYLSMTKLRNYSYLSTFRKLTKPFTTSSHQHNLVDLTEVCLLSSTHLKYLSMTKLRNYSYLSTFRKLTKPFTTSSHQQNLEQLNTLLLFAETITSMAKSNQTSK